MYKQLEDYRNMNNYEQPIPKYYKIYEELLDRIRNGDFKESDRFPSDTELVADFKVSRGTIREALKLLIQQGFLYREQGKGTFVTYSKIHQSTSTLMGFSELMLQNNKTPSAKIIEKKIIDAPPNIKELMELSEDDKIVRIIRVRYGDKVPLIVERSFFVYKYFEPLLDKDLESKSIFSLLYKHTNTKLGQAQQRIEAVNAGQSEVTLLNVDIGSPLLLIKRLIKTSNGDYFQYSEDVYRSDRINFTTVTYPYQDQHDSQGLPMELSQKNW